MRRVAEIPELPKGRDNLQFVTTICIAAICAGLFKLLVPENKFEKQITLLIVCVFLLTGITAVSNAEIDIDNGRSDIETDENYIRISENISDSLRNKICDDLSEKAEKLLNEKGYFPEQIRIIVNISGLYGIEITQVQLVFGEEEQNAVVAAEYLSSELGIPCTVKE